MDSVLYKAIQQVALGPLSASFHHVHAGNVEGTVLSRCMGLIIRISTGTAVKSSPLSLCQDTTKRDYSSYKLLKLLFLLRGGTS